MTPVDPESQWPGPPNRRLSRLRRLTAKSLKEFELDSLCQDQVEEIRTCQNLITLLVDNQPTTPSLNAAGDWYRKFLISNVAHFWPLIRKALDDVKCSSTPSLKDFAVVVCFVYEVAKELIVHKDVALTDIVDSLVNAKFFKPDLEQDDDRIIPNQLVFAVIGWLLFIYEVPLAQPKHGFHIKVDRTTLKSPTGYTNSKSVREYSQGFEFIDKPLFMLLSQFGDILPEIKAEKDQRASFSSVSENIQVQLICYGTAWQVTKLEIEWVESLSLHLELDAARRTLKLFRYPSYCRLMHHRRNIHRRLLTDNFMSARELDKEPSLRADSFFRELLLTYRVLFGQDERSVRAGIRCCAGQDAHRLADPMLMLLCGKPWTTPEARDLYDDINAGDARDTYDSNIDFPIMGARLLELQQFVKDYHPTTLTALLRDRRDPTARFNFWSTQWLLVFGSLAILIAILQLVFQIWQVLLAKEQLALSYPPPGG